MGVEGWVAQAGDIVLAHQSRVMTTSSEALSAAVRAGRKPRKSAAGSNPDGAVRPLGESVGVAVVPDQAVIHVVVRPAGAVPNVHAVLRACPQPSLRVEFEKINHALGASSLHALLNRHAAGLGMDAVNAASEIVADPDDAIWPGAERKDCGGCSGHRCV